MRAVIFLLAAVIAFVYGQTAITKLGEPIVVGVTEGSTFTQYTLSISGLLAGMEPTDKLFFGVTPFIGDTDLYVSATSAPTSTDCPQCILKSTSAYDDIISISKNDAKWPTGDTFYVAVHAYTQTEFTFTVWTTKTNITLHDTIPQVGWTRWVGYTSEFVFYQYTLPSTENFTLSLTPKGGADVDIYITTNPNVRPTSISTSMWHGRRWGFDVVDIPADPSRGKDTTYYIGIGAFLYTAGTTFTLYASVHSNFTRIMEGIPLSGQAEANEFKYFTFDVTSHYGGQRLTYTISPLISGGDPDIFIHRDLSRGLPGPSNCEWCKMSSGMDIVDIENAPQGRYYIGVRAYARITHFQIVAATQHQSIELNPGIAIQGSAFAGKYAYFRYNHRNPQEALTISAVPWKGLVELYASMTITKPDDTKYDYKGVPQGLNRILNFDYRNHSRPTPEGYYYLAVKATTDSNFTMLASTDATYTLLRDGIPVYGQIVRKGQYRYYRFDITNDDLNQTINSVISFTVSTLSGSDADICVSMTNSRPTMTNYTWKADAYSSDTLSIATNDEKIGHHRIFYVGVYGASFSNDAMYDIVAHKSGSVINLSDGQPIKSTVEYNKYTYFRYHVSDIGFKGPIKVTVTCTDTTKRVRAYADDASNQRPTEHHYKWISTSFAQEYLTITATNDGSYYIGVYGRSYGSIISFTIAVSRAYEMLDTNRGNFLRSISDVSQSDRYRFIIDNQYMLRSEIEYLSVALTVISGRARLYLNPATNRTDDESYTTPENALYKSLTPNGNIIMLTKKNEQQHWRNTWNVLVVADEPTDYFISTSTANSVNTPEPEHHYFMHILYVDLTEGTPMLQAVPYKDRFVYHIHISPPVQDQKEDYLISLRVLDGKFSLYAHQDSLVAPGPRNYTFKAENIAQDQTIILPKDKIIYNPWGSSMFISVFGESPLNLKGESNKFEMTMYKASAPRYLSQDQPLPQHISDDQFKDDKDVYTHYRVLNSVEHPDDLEVFVESCADFPTVAPLIYGSATNHHPNAHNFTYKSESKANGLTQYLKTNAETKHQERVFYLGVENKPKHVTARHFSIYATTLDDSRPIVTNSQLTGRVDNEQQLGEATIGITVTFAEHPKRYRDGNNFVYQVYARELHDSVSVDKINYETACAITRGHKMNTVHSRYNDSRPGTVEIFAGPFDKNKKYAVNVLAHSPSISGLASPYKRAYVVNGNFYQDWPGTPGGGMSPAGVFFLVVFILLLVCIGVFITYLIVGFVIKSRQGHKGWEALPNNNVWTKVVSVLTCGKVRPGATYGHLQDEPSTSSSVNVSGRYGTV
jgi:hypothetical protein